jgi:hypothetical protein
MKLTMNDNAYGISIGGYPSQLIGNFVVSDIDHRIKRRCRAYLRYCDDDMGMARTKAEARQQLTEFIAAAAKHGLTVKHGAIVAPIGRVKKQKIKRKRKRSNPQRNYAK